MPLSAKQLGYLAAAWSCFDSEPKIDWEKFQERVGCKSVASARELLRVTKIKLKAEYGGETANGAQASSAASSKAVGSPAYRVTKNKSTGKQTKSSAKKSTATRPQPAGQDESDNEIDPGRDEQPTTNVKMEPGLRGADEQMAEDYY